MGSVALTTFGSATVPPRAQWILGLLEFWGTEANVELGETDMKEEEEIELRKQDMLEWF